MIGALRRTLAAAATAVSALLATTAVAHDDATPPWQAATPWPDRIVTTVTADPTTSFAVTWRTDDSVGRTLAEIAPATPAARFDLGAETIRARTERIELAEFVTEDGNRAYLENQALGASHHHSVVFEDLAPDTLYAFRVMGARGNWSEWFQVRTAPASGPVSFLYLGDAQQGVRTHWARVIRMAHATAPDAGFVLHAGDLVQQGPSDHDWGGWFTAGGHHHAQIPQLPVLGNHEHMRVFTEEGRGPRVPTPLWRAQFTLPVEPELPDRLREQVYAVRYSEDLHVFAMDSTPSDYNQREGWAAQADWLRARLAASDARWKVVSMHHPYFVPLALNGRRAAMRAMQRTFAPVIADGDVDLVLVGHIHAYARSTAEQPGRGMPGPTSARAATGDANDVGTVFVISSATASQGELVTPEAFAARADDPVLAAVDRLAENTPMFQVIRIDGSRLTYRAHMATGEIYDAFELEQGEDGRTRLTEGDAARGETRLFETTEPFRSWHDLQ